MQQMTIIVQKIAICRLGSRHLDTHNN